MKYTLILSALFATALAAPTVDGGKKEDDGGDTICESHESVVCSGNGGGLVTLGNLLNGLLGESCSGGDVYCCSNSDIQNGLINLDLNLQCSLNHLL